MSRRGEDRTAQCETPHFGGVADPPRRECFAATSAKVFKLSQGRGSPGSCIVKSERRITSGGQRVREKPQRPVAGYLVLFQPCAQRYCDVRGRTIARDMQPTETSINVGWDGKAAGFPLSLLQCCREWQRKPTGSHARCRGGSWRWRTLETPALRRI